MAESWGKTAGGVEVGACSIGCDGLAFLGAAGLALLAALLLNTVTAQHAEDFRVISKIFSNCPDASGYKAGNGGRSGKFRAGLKKF
jgi:hypothetical protein